MIVAGFKYREIYFYSDGAGEEKNIKKFHAAIAVAAWLNKYTHISRKKSINKQISIFFSFKDWIKFPWIVKLQF